MNRLRARVTTALFFLSAAAAATSTSAGPRYPSAQATRVKQTDPEHARLLTMCGTWDVEMTVWPQPGGPAFNTKGTSTIRPLFDGLFVEEQIEGALNGAPFTTLAWTGFNGTTHRYEATRISSTTDLRIAETGGYDEATRQFELAAEYQGGPDTWHQRTVIHVVSGDAMTATSYFSFRAVPEWKGVEIKYARRAK